MRTPSPKAAENIVEPAPVTPAPPRGRLREQGPVLVAVALGGVIGASARYGASLLWPTAPGAFPWTTLLVNATGCAVMGVFMVLITDAWTPHRLLRPFAGTGILGGYTTFSTYAAEIQRLLDTGHAATGLAYLASTLVAALGSTWTAATLTRGTIGAIRRRTR